MNGYVGFYKGKRYEIYADTSYHAQQAIAQKYHIKKAYDIAVVLAEKDGKPVTHLPLMNPKESGDLTIHMKGIGSKTACGKPAKGKWMVPFNTDNFRQLTCEQCKSVVRPLIGLRSISNPKVNVDRLAIEAKKKYKDDVKAGHTDGVEYWAGYAGAAFLMSNPGQQHFSIGDRVMLRRDVLLRHARSVPAHAGYTHNEFQWRTTLDRLEGKVGVIERTFPNSKHVNVRFADGSLIGVNSTELTMSNPDKNSGGLGIKIAQAAHNEGRRAFAKGIPEKNNPYKANADRDSDEWLRYHGWKNGWTFAWWNRKYTKYNRNPGAVRAMPDTKMGQLVRMMKTHQATHFVYRQGRVLVDMQTANVLMKAYQALTDRNKARFERMLESWAGLRKLVDLSWKATVRNPMKMMTAEIRKKLPKLYSQEYVKDPIAYVKFFTPWTNWTWWGIEFDGTDRFFGYVSGHENELGYFSLKELESIRGPWGLKIERDLSFRPTPLSEIKRRHP